MNILGKLFAQAFKLQAVARFLQRDVYGHLYDMDGKPYMFRWAVIRTGTRASKLLSFVTRGKYDHARLHWITQPDRDRELHDHPFDYRTFVLQGWYAEQRSDDYVNNVSTRAYLTGQSGAMTQEGYHRISAVSTGGVFTLFFMGEDHGEWGFLVDGKFMESREFFKLRRINKDGTQA